MDIATNICLNLLFVFVLTLDPPQIRIGLVDSSGANFVTISNGSVVLVSSNNIMSLWCDFNIKPTIDSCGWYRPNTDSNYYCADYQSPCPSAPGLSDWEVTMPTPTRDMCQLQAGPLNTPTDTGAWRCALSTRNATQSASVIRKDVTIPEIEWSPVPEITVWEGDLVTLSCGANVQINKMPKMYWSVGGLRYEGNCSVRRLTSQGMDVSTWRVENVLTYSAKLQHSKSNVQCKVLIKDDLNYTIRVPSGIYNGMTVLPRPGPSPFSTHGLSDWEIALIVVGVLVFVSVVIAISVVICFCFGLLCFSGRKKKSGRSDFRQNGVRDSTSSSRRSKVRSIVQYVDIDDLDKDKPIYINGYSSSPKAFKEKRKSSTKSPSFMKNIKSFDDKFSQDSTNVFTYEGGDSRSGSLSSIVSSEDSEDGEHVGSVFSRLGDKFSGLARIYTEDREESMSDATSDKTVVPGPGVESWV